MMPKRPQTSIVIPAVVLVPLAIPVLAALVLGLTAALPAKPDPRAARADLQGDMDFANRQAARMAPGDRAEQERIARELLQWARARN
jgi:hypothetical protein